MIKNKQEVAKDGSGKIRFLLDDKELQKFIKKNLEKSSAAYHKGDLKTLILKTKETFESTPVRVVTEKHYDVLAKGKFEGKKEFLRDYDAYEKTPKGKKADAYYWSNPKNSVEGSIEYYQGKIETVSHQLSDPTVTEEAKTELTAELDGYNKEIEKFQAKLTKLTQKKK